MWNIVEDTDHSDFVALRSVLFGSHLQELREITHEVLYEKYRTEKLSRDPASDYDGWVL
jgi:septin family protein